MEIGTQTFTRGTEITITTNPYLLYGGMFQDGVDSNGRVFTVATPAQIEKNISESRKEWKTQQQGFRRIAK